MADILFCTVYIVLFSYIILKSAFFKLQYFNKIHTLLAFFVKLVFGLLLWYIYAHHYKNRLTSDIFKYYDDSKVIYNAFHSHFSDFIKLITGTGDTDPNIIAYYKQMNSWDNSYESTLYNNSHLIIRLNALFMFFSHSHYGAHVIFMCFLSLVGLVYMFKAFYPYLSEKPWGLFAAVFLFPSVLLWGSGVLKEGFILLGLGLTIYYAEALMKANGSKLKSVLLFALGLILLLESKAYVLVCILPCFIAEFLIHSISIAKKHPTISYLLVTVIYLGVGFNLGHVNARFDAIRMIAIKQTDFNRLSRGGIYIVKQGDSSLHAYLPIEDTAAIRPANQFSDSLLRNAGMQYISSTAFCNKEKLTNHPALFTIKKGVSYVQYHVSTTDTMQVFGNDSTTYWIDVYTEPAKSGIVIAPIKPNLFGLMHNIPSALAISVIRPYPGEIHSGAVLIYAAENAIVLLLIILAIIFMKRGNPNMNKIWFCLIYCLLTLALIGLVTPLYGGIERYKVVVMPFLLILLLLIYDKEKVKRLFKSSRT